MKLDKILIGGFLVGCLAFIGYGVNTTSSKNPPKNTPDTPVSHYWNGTVPAKPVFIPHMIGSDYFSASLSLDSCVKTIYSDNTDNVSRALVSAIKPGDTVRVAISNLFFSSPNQSDYRIDNFDSVWVNGKLLDL